jgi:hypothetical protein
MDVHRLDTIIAKLNRRAVDAYVVYERRLRGGLPVEDAAKRFRNLDRWLKLLRQVRAALAAPLDVTAQLSPQ